MARIVLDWSRFMQATPTRRGNGPLKSMSRPTTQSCMAYSRQQSTPKCELQRTQRPTPSGHLFTTRRSSEGAPPRQQQHATRILRDLNHILKHGQRSRLTCSGSRDTQGFPEMRRQTDARKPPNRWSGVFTSLACIKRQILESGNAAYMENYRYSWRTRILLAQRQGDRDLARNQQNSSTQTRQLPPQSTSYD